MPSRAGSNVSSHAASEDQKETTVDGGDTRDTTEAKHTAAGDLGYGEGEV